MMLKTFKCSICGDPCMLVTRVATKQAPAFCPFCVNDEDATLAKWKELEEKGK